ncbi:transposase [Brevibacillus laterosporus]|uniref:transposase n=1 Tax=Brevibacillus laterosporus TaxID=1465 RepID=UPI00215841CF|nr:transposase [Brevibacillus laterosporus]MBG9771892.1 hypothetical protein [Brevibacillus laterosporus]
MKSAKKRRTNIRYTEEIKTDAVRLVIEENMSYRVAKQLGIRNKTQVLVWVTRYKEGQPFQKEAFRKERPKTRCASVEEEMTYLRAEIEYLKKRYPNLHKGDE